MWDRMHTNTHDTIHKPTWPNSPHLAHLAHTHIHRSIPNTGNTLKHGVSQSSDQLEAPSDQLATIIDGKAIAQTIRSEIADEVRLLSQKYGKVPGLTVVIVATRKDSQSYVTMKRKACAEVEIKSFDIDLPEQVSEAEVINKVHELNALPDVHGILVQLPLPKHINEEKELSEIIIEKDVDGFRPLNIGKLVMKEREPLFIPCTPKGCLEFLSRNGVSIKGKKVVVVGRSNVVGLPVSLLLLKSDATVSIVHSHTKDCKNPVWVCLGQVG